MGSHDEKTRSRSRERNDPPGASAGSKDKEDDKSIEEKFQAMYDNIIAPKIAESNEAVKTGVKALVVGELQALEARVDNKLATVQASVTDVKADVTEVKTMVSRIEAALADGASARLAAPSYASVVGNGSGSNNMGNGNLPPPSPFPPSYPASFPRAPQGLLTPESLNQSKFWNPPNKCRLLANTLAGVKVSLEKFQASITKLADEAALKPEYFPSPETPCAIGLRYSFQATLKQQPGGQLPWLSPLNWVKPNTKNNQFELRMIRQPNFHQPGQISRTSSERNLGQSLV